MNRTQLKGWVAAAALVAFGAAMGVSAQRILADDAKGPRSSQSEKDPIELTPQQREQILEIIERSQPKLDSVWSQARAGLNAVIDSSAAEIRPILRPDQIPDFEKWVADVRATFNAAASGKHPVQSSRN